MNARMAQAIESEKNMRIIFFVFFAFLTALLAIDRYPDTGMDLIELGLLGLHMLSDLFAIYHVTRKIKS